MQNPVKLLKALQSKGLTCKSTFWAGWALLATWLRVKLWNKFEFESKNYLEYNFSPPCPLHP